MNPYCLRIFFGTSVVFITTRAVRPWYAINALAAVGQRAMALMVRRLKNQNWSRNFFMSHWEWLQETNQINASILFACWTRRYRSLGRAYTIDPTRERLALAKTTIMKFDFDAVLKLITFPEMIAAGDLLFLPFPNAFGHLMHCKNT